MTEAEWRKCKTPYPMFDFIGKSTSPRKLRLFGIACCRRIWGLMDERCRRAVSLAGRLVEGQATVEEADQRYEQLRRAYNSLNEEMDNDDKSAQVKLWCLGAAQNTLRDDSLPCVWQGVASAVANHHVERVGDPPPPEMYMEHQAHAALLREVLGPSPFRRIAFDPAWRSSDALAFAYTIYSGTKFDRMPILADALEEAGCGDESILTHCRQPGEHMRGCWVVDLVLGKE